MGEPPPNTYMQSPNMHAECELRAVGPVPCTRGLDQVGGEEPSAVHMKLVSVSYRINGKG